MPSLHHPPPPFRTSRAAEAYKKGPVRQFFPPLSKLDPPYPIAPDGILPNSVILQQLRKSEEDRNVARDWQPSTLTDEEIAAMASRKKVQTPFVLVLIRMCTLYISVSFYEPVCVCVSVSVQPDAVEEEEEEDPDNEFFRKMKALMDQGFAESEEPTPTPTPTPPPTPPVSWHTA